jgi:hypothetical protein
MTKLPYLRTMFATCMLFQVIFTLCVLLWFVDPNLKGALLTPCDFSELCGDRRDHFCVLL